MIGPAPAHARLRSSLGSALVVVACGPKPSSGDDAATTGPPPTTAATSGSSSSTLESTTASSTVVGTGTSDASSGAATSSGDSGAALEELCPTATTEADCTAAHEWCRWYASYRVDDLETCALDEPVFGCWATDPTGSQGCFGFYPLACHDVDVQPVYRELRGAFHVIDLDGACQFVPRVADGDVPWTICPGDEFRSPPPACYCLCGGVPDTTSSTG